MGRTVVRGQNGKPCDQSLIFTEEDWYAALLGDEDILPHGKTALELCRLLGIKPRTMNRRIRKALEKGTLIEGLAYRVDAAGRRQPVPVYAPNPGGEGESNADQ